MPIDQNLARATVRSNKGALIKWTIIGLSVAVVAPVAFLVLKGIVGLAAAGIVGLSAINFGPVIAMKLANQKVKAVIVEAQTNPIETLYNELSEKRQAAEKFKESITAFRTEVKNFADRTEQFRKQYPDDAARFDAQLDTMNKLLAFREGRYKQVQDELKRFSDAIDRARALWDMSQSAQRMNKIAGLQTGDVFAQIKTDAALDSVMNSVNKAFSEMETSLMENPEVRQANAQASAVLPSPDTGAVANSALRIASPQAGNGDVR
ncbi:hypothetical protein WK76_24880 [Burkholderia ubonensis]|uniref:hypothetical protein n=1 Tax=Burkholderia ubonensis TaxID=101571 RepID=UPI0007591189|nr:hypothetical protein [Burkholderia ubonensis]KVU84267.1 hypothetical protein WK76_24880 [Burkholderia ubonensis]